LYAVKDARSRANLAPLLVGKFSSKGNYQIVDPPNSKPTKGKEEKQTGANLAYIKAMNRGKQEQEQDHEKNTFIADF
jgi:hypothetical protein